MGKKIKRDEYNLRTLAFYQKQGGVYSDLITVLQKARTDRNVVTYIPRHTPARLLNMASYIAALVMEDKENSARLIDLEKQKLANLHKEDQCLIFSIVYLLIGDLDIEGANQELMEYIGTSTIYKKLSAAYHKEAFKGKLPLQEVLSSEERTQLEEIIKSHESTIKTQEEIIQTLDSTIADQSSQIDMMRDAISLLTQKIELAQADTLKGSKLDKLLTLDFIIGQIERRRTYKNSCQLIDMLKGRPMRIATEEEVAKIERIEQKMLDASVPRIHNDIRDSQVFQGPVNNATFQLPIGVTAEMANEAIEQYLKKMNNAEQE